MSYLIHKKHIKDIDLNIQEDLDVFVLYKHWRADRGFYSHKSLPNGEVVFIHYLIYYLNN